MKRIVERQGANRKARHSDMVGGVQDEELELDRERYTVMTASNHFELTNGLTAVARARANLVEALFQLNAARVNLSGATGNLNTLQ